MLTYTFSKREKFLIVLLVVVAIAVVWYKFVFLEAQNRIQQVDSQIANLQDEMIVGQSRSAQLANMQKKIDEFEQQGVAPIVVPKYDNTQSLMAFLNGAMAGTKDYNLSFDEPELAEEGMVHRVGTISFTTNTYQQARAVVQNIAHGPYPCTIKTLGIADKAKEGSSASTDASFQTNMEVDFLEKAPAGAKVGGDKQESAGQDLSKMSDWNK